MHLAGVGNGLAGRTGTALGRHDGEVHVASPRERDLGHAVHPTWRGARCQWPVRWDSMLWTALCKGIRTCMAAAPANLVER